ncbi:methyl-accepting chemotaxis protein [Duganella lactea]|nr:methyl-accepting chemotaxis protein [Duganella lactea]
MSPARNVADGDLTRAIDVRSVCETGQLMQALKDMTVKLQQLVSQVRQGTDTIATASSQIASGNQDLSSRTEQQANQLAQSASGIAKKGGEVVGQVVGTMASINASSRKKVDIISVIDGIAFQTNILALNAAVVAGEVRSLAHRSAAAAKDIKLLIGDLVEKVESGSVLVNQAAAAAESMQEQAALLSEVVSVFKLLAVAPARPAPMQVKVPAPAAAIARVRPSAPRAVLKQPQPVKERVGGDAWEAF